MSRPGPPNPQTPISYKTVPGRNRTQKWQQAKTYNYDGDDWGGYDPYDEYGEPGEAPAPPPPIPQHQQYGQRAQRQNSFDTGDERRQFSSGNYPPPSLSRGNSPAGGTGINNGQQRRPSDDYDRRMQQRVFSNPDAAPPPLAMRSSPAPSPGGATPASAGVPPRKSSMSNVSSPVHENAAAAKPAEKPLPFIRPSDIYRRMAEEKERASQSSDSDRPTVDALHREAAPRSTVGSRGTDSSAGSSNGRKPSLDPVVEPKPATRAFGEPESASRLPGPSLPPVSRISGFGSEFLRGIVPAQPTSQSAPQPASSSSDAAAEILSERQHAVPVNAVGRGAQPLQHQSSNGLRSMVNSAFDGGDDGSVPATPLSRDGSNSMGSGAGTVSRSGTLGSSGSSPILSRVPVASTIESRQQARDVPVSPIPEEAGLTPTQPRPVSGQAGMPGFSSVVTRKPSPSHNRNPSADTARAGGAQQGYRQSLDVPPKDNSPARTPSIENTSSRRLSGPLAADMVSAPKDAAESPAIVDQAAELPIAHLEPAETPASETVPAPITSTQDAPSVPIATRGRSGTDYSVRESDLAQSVNAAPDTPSFNHPVAEDQRASQQSFLRIHTGTPGPVTPSSPNFRRSPSPFGLGIASPVTPTTAAGRDSPAQKGRVREIAQTYNAINDASRRNSTASSKSSWSNFRAGSQESLPLRRQETSRSEDGGSAALASEDEQEDDSMFPSYEHSQDRSRNGSTVALSPLPAPGIRPGLGTAPSFQPHLPGEWISAAPTPAIEAPASLVTEPEGRRGSASPRTPRASYMGPASQSPSENLDLTPTIKRAPMQARDPNSAGNTSGPASALSQVKDAGTALGAALMSTAGLTSVTRDFGSKEPAEPVKQPEMQPRPAAGNISGYLRPTMYTQDSDAATSAASSAPPTPPSKDTPQPQPNAGALPKDARPVSSYFANAIAPLRVGGAAIGQSRENPSEQKVFAAPSTLSIEPGYDDTESDRLRKEIVRSLSPEKKEDLQRQSILEDTNRLQDALDAPLNASRVEHGESALPPAEARPQILDQRFSWENRDASNSQDEIPNARTGLSVPHADQDPEIRPKMPYERPRSRNLHIMNADSDESEDEADAAPTSLTQERSAEDAPMSDRVPATMLEAAEGTRPTDVSRQESGFLDKINFDSPRVDINRTPSPPSAQHGTTDDVDSSLPSYYQTDIQRDGEPTAPPPPAKDTSAPTSPSSSKPQTARKPPFREILAIKSAPDRIRTYDTTREAFANADSGLNDWLSQMLAQHPEHANLSSQPIPAQAMRSGPSLSSGMGTFRHKHSPSIMKFTKQFTSSNASEGLDRKASTSGVPEDADSAGGIDRERMQQKGKDLMKSAGVLGGKAQAGAKGLFAKGRSRFGGKRDSMDGSGKAPPPNPASSSLLQQPRSPKTAGAANAVSSTLLSSTPIVASADAASTTSHATTPSPTLEDTTANATDDSDTLIKAPDAPLPTPAPSPRSEASASPLPHPQSPTSSSVAPSPRPLSHSFFRLRDVSRAKSKNRNTAPPVQPLSPPISAFASSNTELVVGADDEKEFAAAQLALGASDPSRRSNRNKGNAALLLRSEWADSWKTRETSVWANGSNDDGSPAAKSASPVAPFLFGAPESRSSTPARLGVLPSPSVDAFFVPDRDGGPGGKEVNPFDVLPESDREAEEEAAAAETLRAKVIKEVARHHGSPVYDDEEEVSVAVQGGSLEPTKTNGEPLGGDDDVADKVYQDRTQDPARPTRPTTERKVSALASLPSQQRAAAAAAASRSNPASPKSAFTSLASTFFFTPRSNAEEEEDEEEDLYSATPTAGKARSPVSDTFDQDMSTPIATALPIRFPDIGARDASEQNEGDTKGTGAAFVDSLHPTAAVDVDKRSEVSAEGVLDNLQHGKEDDLDLTQSRRSSISSLGSPDITSAQTAQKPAVQVPFGAVLPTEPPQVPLKDEFVTSLEASASQEPRPAVRQRSISAGEGTVGLSGFMGQTYQGGDERQRPRPKSQQAFSTKPGDEVSQLGSSAESPDHNIVDVSTLGGPSTSPTPFQPQDPALPQAQQTTEPDPTATSAYGRPNTADDSKRSSKRFSGFFRFASRARGASMSTASASRPNSQYNLEDLTMLGGGSVPSSAVRESASDDKQAKRRSGLWDAFKRSPSMTRSAVHREPPSVAANPVTAPAIPVCDPYTVPVANRTDPPRQQRTLQKVQRAASAATPPTEAKKKSRLSGLGSLFGRSNTQGRNTPKPNKLSKMPIKQGVVLNTEPATSAPTESQQSMPDAYPRPSPFVRPTTAIQHDIAAPPQGWYGPDRHEPQLSRPQNTDPTPISPYRTLHSQGQSRGLPYANIPEAFRPTEASYGRQLQPVGPPVETQAPYQDAPPLHQQPTLPTRQPYWSGKAARPVRADSDRGRQPSYGSVGGLLQQSTTPSTYDRAGYGQTGDCMTSTAPIHIDTAQDYDRISPEETARSPAREYPDQQTPWPITLPQGDEHSRRSSRHASLTRQSAMQYGHTYDPRQNTAPFYPQETQYPQAGPQRRQSSYTADPSTPYSPAPYSSTNAPLPRRQSYGPTNTYPNNPNYAPSISSRHGSFPHDTPIDHLTYPDYYYDPSNDRYPPLALKAAPPPAVQRQQRYYASINDPIGPSSIADGQSYPQQPQQIPSQPQWRQSSDRRRSSGYAYTGRRDDMAVSEEMLFDYHHPQQQQNSQYQYHQAGYGTGDGPPTMMRGTSYPGEEWAPHL